MHENEHKTLSSLPYIIVSMVSSFSLDWGHMTVIDLPLWQPLMWPSQSIVTPLLQCSIPSCTPLGSLKQQLLESPSWLCLPVMSMGYVHTQNVQYMNSVDINWDGLRGGGAGGRAQRFWSWQSWQYFCLRSQWPIFDSGICH